MPPPEFQNWKEEAAHKAMVEKIRPHAVEPQYFCHFTTNNPNRTCIGDDLFPTLNLIQLTDLAVRLCSPKFEKPLSIKSWYGRPRLVTTPIAKSFISFLVDVENRAFHFPQHRVQPQLRLMIAMARRTKLKHAASNFQYLLPAEFEAAAQEYNALIEKTRTALLSSGLREKLKSFQRNSKNCQSKFRESFQQRIEMNRKVLLMGLVTGERRSAPRIHANDTDQKTFNTQAKIFGQLRKEMLKSLRNTFGKSLLFYAWKLEWGNDRGWHIHWFIVVNGSDYQDRINVAFHIAKDWDEVSNGATHTQSLNGMKSGERKGYRVFNYWEPEIWFHAGEIAKYLTKIDLTMKLRLPQGMRSFGCSNLLKSMKKRGPSRQYEFPIDPNFLI